VQSSESKKSLFTPSRVWDVLAAAAIAFAVWKIFIAPRVFMAPGAHRAPLAVYERLDGGRFSVAGQRGHVVFLDFYATWCVPCKAELPLVMAWARSHPDAVVVPVDVAESRSVAEPFARRFQLGSVALDFAASSRAFFGVVGFPTVVVIDPAGNIRAKWEGLNPAIGLAMSNALKSL
jgi:cytochrome c biogenesis protein CcmG, thiol:disulfide interchange protein DsbE